MGVKYFLVLYGIVEFLFGVYICKSKNTYILKLLIEGFNGRDEIDFDNITFKKDYAKWSGEMILMGGAIYIFIASVALSFEFSSLLTFILILVIELKIFKKIINEYKRFI